MKFIIILLLLLFPLKKSSHVNFHRLRSKPLPRPPRVSALIGGKKLCLDTTPAESHQPERMIMSFATTRETSRQPRRKRGSSGEWDTGITQGGTGFHSKLKQLKQNNCLKKYTGAAFCNAHGQCDQIFTKVGDGRVTTMKTSRAF